MDTSTNTIDGPIPASATASVIVADRNVHDEQEPSGYELARSAGALRFWDDPAENVYDEDLE